VKGTMVAGIAGLVALVAVGAAGGALLVERTLTEEATRSLAAQGLDARVTFGYLWFLHHPSPLTTNASGANIENLQSHLKIILCKGNDIRICAVP